MFTSQYEKLKEEIKMAKKVFSRIWRTFMIVINTVFNLCSAVFLFVTMFETSSYVRANNVEGWIYSVLIILVMNVVDFVVRKHFENY